MGGVLKGSRNGRWKGGRIIASNGYPMLKRPEHPAADVRGYVYEHHVRAGGGGQGRRGPIVHHRDGRRGNSSAGNVVLVGRGTHGQTHGGSRGLVRSLASARARARGR